jgi:hypothetical protein
MSMFAESLSGVETLVSHPASMNNASVPPEDGELTGITDELVRIGDNRRQRLFCTSLALTTKSR